MSAETTKRVARVLSISGDGARTAIAAHVLAELERRTGQPVHKLFHMIVGEGAGRCLGHVARPAQCRRAGAALGRRSRGDRHR